MKNRYTIIFFLLCSVSISYGQTFPERVKSGTIEELGISEREYYELENEIIKTLVTVQKGFSRLVKNASNGKSSNNKKLKQTIIDQFETRRSIVEKINSPWDKNPIGQGISSYLNTTETVAMRRALKGWSTVINWLKNSKDETYFKVIGPTVVKRGVTYQIEIYAIQLFSLLNNNMIRNDKSFNIERYVVSPIYKDVTQKQFEIRFNARKVGGKWQVKLHRIWALNIQSYSSVEECLKNNPTEYCIPIKEAKKIVPKDR